MKLSHLFATAFLIAPLMSHADFQTQVEPLSAEEKGQIGVWLEGMDHHGDRDQDRDQRDGSKDKMCPGLTLDETQKAAMKTAHIGFAKDMNTAKAEIKNTLIDYAVTLADANSTKDQGTASGNAVKDAVGKMADIKIAFETNIMYDILKPEQREPALKCAMERMKEMARKKLEKACKDMRKR